MLLSQTPPQVFQNVEGTNGQRNNINHILGFTFDFDSMHLGIYDFKDECRQSGIKATFLPSCHTCSNINNTSGPDVHVDVWSV